MREGEVVYNERSGRLALKTVNYIDIELDALREDRDVAERELTAAQTLKDAGYEVDDVVAKAEAKYEATKSKYEVGEGLVQQYGVQPAPEATGGEDSAGAEGQEASEQPEFVAPQTA